MLSVARRAAAHVDRAIRWEQASADDLPFPDAGFDAVLCQQGLQFFPDPASALAQMRRVARPGARLGLSTAPAGEVIRSSYAFGEPEKLRALFTHAGFEDVRLRIGVWAVRFSSPEGLLGAETASSPLGDLVGALDHDVRDALKDDLRAALLPHTDDGVVFPFETSLVTAARGELR